jgi:hypothetical protein
VTHMKKSKRGCPSSASKNEGFANELNSWLSRPDAVTLSFLKYGAALDIEMISAGKRALSVPVAVETTAWIAYHGHEIISRGR